MTPQQKGSCMRTNLGRFLLAALPLLLLVGCTLEEWKRVGGDAIHDLPEAGGQLLTNPTPSGLGLAIAMYLSGLFTKSAARGFGKAVVAVKNKVTGQ